MSTMRLENDFAQDLVHRSPSWFASLAVHACIILILVQIPFASALPPELPPVKIDMALQMPAKIEEPLTDERQLVFDEPTPIPSDLDIDKPGDDFAIDDPLSKEPPGIPEAPDDSNRLEQPDLARIAIGTNGPPKNYTLIVGGRPSRGSQEGPKGRSRNQGDPYIGLALSWLARHQEPDGRWDSKKWGARGNYDVGCTALALEAFLAGGYTHNEGKYSRNVVMALQWLRKQQDKHGGNGNFGCPRFYGQGIATMACADAYGMTGTPWVSRIAQKGLDFIVETQPDNGGFDYLGARNAHNDTSITGWQIMAIKTCYIVGLDVPANAIEKSKRYLRESINPDGTTGYRGTESANAAMTSVGLLCRVVLGWDKSHPDCKRAAKWLIRKRPDTGDLYYCYYSALAFQQRGGSQWNRWWKQVEPKIRDAQVKSADMNVHGSWNPTTKWGTHAGRVYTTAMSALVLSTPNRFTMLSRQ